MRKMILYIMDVFSFGNRQELISVKHNLSPLCHLQAQKENGRIDDYLFVGKQSMGKNKKKGSQFNEFSSG